MLVGGAGNGSQVLVRIVKVLMVLADVLIEVGVACVHVVLRRPEQLLDVDEVLLALLAQHLPDLVPIGEAVFFNRLDGSLLNEVMKFVLALGNVVASIEASLLGPGRVGQVVIKLLPLALVLTESV